MQFKYKGYALVQSDLNNHYMILDSNDKMCMHAQCTKRLTDKEKIEAIERFIKLKNSDFLEKTERDADND